MTKKMAFGFSLALATFCLFLSPAMAETNLPQAAPVLSASDQAFLASLATPVAPTLAAKRPAVRQKALCSATASCGDGTIVGCESNSSATSCSAADRNCSGGEQGHVTCDGVTQWCPTPCPVNCPQEEYYCATSCYPCSYRFTCDQATGDTTCRCNFRTCPV